MDQTTLNTVIYPAIAAILGAIMHMLYARFSGAAPTTPGAPTGPAPASPDHLTIGHGALLQLLLGALAAGSSAPAPLPAPAPMDPAKPVTQGDLAAIIAGLQQPAKPAA